MPRLEAVGSGDGLRSGAVYAMDQGCIFGLFQLVLNWKLEQILGKLPGINQVLAVWLIAQGVIVWLPGLVDTDSSYPS